ncbi:gamma-glutamylcyclotransferase [Cupriavidus sp. UYPR2.512]|uniref:gamma-glutamylcyclotransferase family protein n=1 Tax=Cupriavidus sp. UYPR2.512 TaxID=1080187 RepID=UPI000380E63D|nr:gamma-glutamylcyclotransferase family protein [Cupriavidus sp. UYPR2.512]UIF84927.1 gamma-glutamylcyclotransferase [Cupriavidus necator]
MPRVFVYGTLRAGEVNDLNAAAQRHGIAAPALLGTGTIAGRLFDFGTYPGLVLDASGGPVVGDIYEIADALLPVLDEIEEVYPGQATLFVREERAVLQDGQPVACLLYPVAESAVATLPRIDSGDWVAYRRARDHAAA